MITNSQITITNAKSESLMPNHNHQCLSLPQVGFAYVPTLLEFHCMANKKGGRLQVSHHHHHHHLHHCHHHHFHHCHHHRRQYYGRHLGRLGEDLFCHLDDQEEVLRCVRSQLSTKSKQ